MSVYFFSIPVQFNKLKNKPNIQYIKKANLYRRKFKFQINFKAQKRAEAPLGPMLGPPKPACSSCVFSNLFLGSSFGKLHYVLELSLCLFRLRVYFNCHFLYRYHNYI